jgi:hypothetical protein
MYTRYTTGRITCRIIYSNSLIAIRMLLSCAIGQDKRAMKIGIDFGLSVGKKLNQNMTVDSGTVGKNEQTGGNKTNVFTVSK